MQKFDLFPTLVCADLYSEHEAFKQTFFDNISNYTRQDGITGEASGFVDLHLNKEFSSFFEYVTSVANNYVNTIVDEDVWVLWLVKSWYNNFPVPTHNHADSHLSFVYFVNVPAECDQTLNFLNPKTNLNDLTSGMFLGELNKPTSFQRNQYNCSAIEVPSSEGCLIVFPSKLDHFVKAADINPLDNDPSKCRITLAGDFIITFKEPTARSMGLQPVRNWRQFNV